MSMNDPLQARADELNAQWAAEDREAELREGKSYALPRIYVPGVAERGEEYVALAKVAGDVVNEWAAFIGDDESEGHDDPFRVGEKVRALRDALVALHAETP